MMPSNRRAAIGVVLPTLLAVSQVGCGGGKPQQPITVTVTAPTILQAGATAQLVATVTGASSGADGVTWAVSCTSSSCGGVSPTATGNQQPATYTAPTTLPSSNLNVTVTAASAAKPASSGSATITIPFVAVTVAPLTAAVPSGGSQQFTATVMGDSKNAGVTWSMSKSYCQRIALNDCFPTTSPCDSTCGTVSSANTASGSPLTYTAPAAPPPCPASCRGIAHVSLVATSVTDSIVSTRTSISVSPISVSVSSASASVTLNATLPFTATVTNDGTNSGVTWTLTQNGAPCSPGCGNITSSTASGAPATYAAPAKATVLPAVTVTAASVEDSAKSASTTVTFTTSTGGLACGAGSGSESLLKGQYAFLLRGVNRFGAVLTGGSFATDGTGRITGGEEDIQGSGPVASDTSIEPSGSLYAVGPDHRGCMVLVNANGTTASLLFALGSINSGISAAGQAVEFDASGGGTRASGTIRLQDASSFTASQFNGNYAFGALSMQQAVAGTFNSDGVSAIATNTIDADFTGTVTSNATSTPGGSFTCCSANGRGLLQITSPLGLATFAMYLINGGHVLLVSDMAYGEAIGIPAATTFSQTSLSGTSVLRETALSSSGPIVGITTVVADGKGAITANENINSAGMFTTSSSAFNDLVGSNGRVALSGGSSPAVLYLYGPNQGFLVGTDANVTFGILEPQAAGPFSNSSFAGTYTMATENPSANTVTIESGVVTADGTGNAGGTSDQSSSSGPPASQSLNITYSIGADGTGNVGNGTTVIMISPSKLVFIDHISANPTITVVEK